VQQVINFYTPSKFLAGVFVLTFEFPELYSKFTCLHPSAAAEAVLQVAFVVAEAQGANVVAYTAIGVVVICSVVVLAYDFQDLKISAVLFARSIRLVFST
jgi:hypothetical protein